MSTPPTTTQWTTVSEQLSAGWQLPAELYSEERFFELEREQIFARSWQFVARSSQLASAGDFVTCELGGTPIVVNRTKSGDLKAHVNVCLHRLHPVASGSGCKAIMQCIYHGWTYDLDGKLRTAPRSAMEEGFDKSELKLAPVSVAEYGGMVFANPDPNAMPLSEVVGEADASVRALSLDIDEWDHTETFVYEVEANWKLFMENSLECYHCDLVHGDTFGDAFATDPVNYVCENFDEVLTQVAPIEHPPATEHRSREELEQFRLFYVWPNTAMSLDEYAGAITRVIPLGVKRCKFIVDIFARPGVAPETLASWLEMYDTTFKQDKVVVMAQQAGYDSGRVARGRLLPHNESSISMFQQRTWRALEASLTTEEVAS